MIRIKADNGKCVNRINNNIILGSCDYDTGLWEQKNHNLISNNGDCMTQNNNRIYAAPCDGSISQMFDLDQRLIAYNDQGMPSCVAVNGDDVKQYYGNNYYSMYDNNLSKNKSIVNNDILFVEYKQNNGLEYQPKTCNRKFSAVKAADDDPYADDIQVNPRWRSSGTSYILDRDADEFKCRPGFSGKNCMKPVCNNVPENGTCIENYEPTAQIQCKKNWYGDNCDVFCDDRTCIAHPELAADIFYELCKRGVDAESIDKDELKRHCLNAHKFVSWLPKNSDLNPNGVQIWDLYNRDIRSEIIREFLFRDKYGKLLDKMDADLAALNQRTTQNLDKLDYYQKNYIKEKNNIISQLQNEQSSIRNKWKELDDELMGQYSLPDSVVLGIQQKGQDVTKLTVLQKNLDEQKLTVTYFKDILGDLIDSRNENPNSVNKKEIDDATAAYNGEMNKIYDLEDQIDAVQISLQNMSKKVKYDPSQIKLKAVGDLAQLNEEIARIQTKLLQKENEKVAQQTNNDEKIAAAQKEQERQVLIEQELADRNLATNNAINNGNSFNSTETFKNKHRQQKNNLGNKVVETFLNIFSSRK